MDIEAFLFWVQNENGLGPFTVQVGGIFLIAFLFNALLRLTARWIRHSARKESLFRYSLGAALFLPLRVLTWGLAILFVLQTVEQHFQWSSTGNFLEKGRIVLASLCITWLFLRWRSQIEKKWHAQKRGQTFSNGVPLNAVGRAYSVAIVAIMGMIALQSLGVPIGAVLAFGGVGGAAAAFASRDVLSNFFSGLMLYATRPFNVGDWIQSPDRNIEGTVEHMGWCVTRVRSFEKRPIYVPNSVFTSIVIVNPSRMTNRRIRETIGVRYDDVSRLKGIIEDIRQMLKEHSEIDQNLIQLVHFVKFNDFSLDILVYTFTKTKDWKTWLDVQQDVFFRISAIITAHGAEVAFPTRTLHVVEGDAETPT